MGNKSLKPNITGDVRFMAARWVITGNMTLQTAAHFGGEGADIVDMMILRDSQNDRPLLPGTSLAGALRSHLADVLGGYRSKEDSLVAALFGAARESDNGDQSPLIVFDSIGKLPEGMVVEIRDGVTINPATGTAEAHMKFDLEVLPAGTIFPVRVELIIEDPAGEPKLLSLLAEAMDGLKEGDISLGMRRSRGLGAIKADSWRAVRHDLTTKEGWLSWLTSDHENPFGEKVKPYQTPIEALQAAYPSIVMEKIGDKRERVTIDLDLKIPGDLLVRSPGTDPAAPDTVHLHSAGKPVLPGTSLAGALRSYALRITRLVRESWMDGDEWVNQLFGRQADKDKYEDPSGEASRLRVTESFVRNGHRRRQTRIAVDRFTGGVVQGALFDEEVQAGGQFNVRLELRKPNSGEIGLLLLLLKDLLTGDLPVGGATAVGRGVLKGTAMICLQNKKRHAIDHDLNVSDEVRALFNSYISAFHEAKSLKQKEMKS